MNDESYIGGKMIVLETDESLGISIIFLMGSAGNE
jgi:hypothetical protein